MPRTQILPARIYSTPEYRRGYEAGGKAARAQGPQENPYLSEDLRHLGWADACYDNWSARRVELQRMTARRAESPPTSCVRQVLQKWISGLVV